ncbi:hypothetical protein ACJJTC_006484 [Scirpophaga incertulas]
MTEQEKCGEASLRISWILAKHMKPFTDADVVKECFLEVGNALFENKKDVVETIRRIPLSASTSTRNTHVLAEENHCDVKRRLNNANYYDLAMDESCDITDTAQLIIFVRYLDQTKETFVEEILALLPLLGKTRGEDINKAIMDFFDKDELDLKKLLSVTTDGAPAMVGSNKGLVHLLSSNASDQTSANAYLSFLKEKENVAAIAFLTDIFKHINDLNLKLQGKGKLVWELMSEVKSFTRKLDLFINDVGSERLHFPNLNKIISSDSEIDVGQYKTFITDLKSEFENRFVDFKKIENVVEILSSIYSLHPDEDRFLWYSSHARLR